MGYANVNSRGSDKEDLNPYDTSPLSEVWGDIAWDGTAYTAFTKILTCEAEFGLHDLVENSNCRQNLKRKSKYNNNNNHVLESLNDVLIYCMLGIRDHVTLRSFARDKLQWFSSRLLRTEVIHYIEVHMIFCSIIEFTGIYGWTRNLFPEEKWFHSFG